ncbi:hypothetical protein HID58_077808, partial [Brassica napus]
PHNLPGTVSEADLQAMISGVGDFSRRRRDSSPPDLLSFFVYSVVFYLGLCFHPLLLVLIFGGKGPPRIQRQKHRALEPDISMALSIWLLLSTVLSIVTHSRLVVTSVASSLVVVHAPAQLAVTPVSVTLLVTAQLTEASGCVKFVCTFTDSIHMAPTTSIQSTHARLSSPQSPLSSNIEAAPSWHVLNGAELHSLRLSPTPSSARCGPLWLCLLPQPETESAKGPFFPPRLDLPDPPDCASSGFSEPPSRFIKDSEPRSDDQYLIYSLTDSMKQRTRLGSAKARVFQHGNVGVQSCVLNNVLSLPWILVNVIYICWSEVFEKSIVYMGLETTLASVYRVHLAQNRDVMLNLRILFVQPSQVSRVCSNSNFVTCAIRFQGPPSLFISDKSRTGILSSLRRASSELELLLLVPPPSKLCWLVYSTSIPTISCSWGASDDFPRFSGCRFVMFCLAVLLVFIKLSSFPLVFILLPLSIAPDVIT